MIKSPFRELDVARVRRWCPLGARARAPPGPCRCQIARAVSPSSSDAPHGVGRLGRSGRPPDRRLRYKASDKTWALYWRDHNLRFHVYDLLSPVACIDDALAESKP